jgi:hypothetical protein
MYQYDSVSHALEELRKKGYTTDFNLEENCLVCNTQKFTADDFDIKEVVRFEGNSDPADEAIVYGIESKTGVKGVLVNGYGYSSDSMGEEIAKKLTMHAH